MTTFSHRSRVEAPVSEVWAFHSTTRGLVSLTPRFMHLRVESTEGPEGDPDPGELVEGSRVHVSVRPFGVGPRQTWTAHIVERESGDDEPFFRDEMENGPFARWEHTHRFEADGDGTIMEDVVEYELPGGSLGRAASPLGMLGMAPMFRHRHRRTRALVE